MDHVVIGSNSAKRELTCTQRSTAGAPTSMQARLRVPGLTCEQDVYDFDGHSGLSAFFDGLGEAWRGWQGERAFVSLEGDLEITATHRGSQVTLRVELLHGIESDEWRATANVDIDAGEDLTRAVRDLRQLVGRA